MSFSKHASFKARQLPQRDCPTVPHELGGADLDFRPVDRRARTSDRAPAPWNRSRRASRWILRNSLIPSVVGVRAAGDHVKCESLRGAAVRSFPEKKTRTQYGVQQEPDHHLRMVRRIAAQLSLEVIEDLPEFQLGDDVQDKGARCPSGNHSSGEGGSKWICRGAYGLLTRGNDHSKARDVDPRPCGYRNRLPAWPRSCDTEAAGS